MKQISKFYLSIILFVLMAQAAISVAEPEQESSWQFSLGVGAGVRSNPLEHGDNIPLVLLPQWHYDSARVFVDNLDLGVHLFQSDEAALNALITPSYDQIFFHDWSSGNFFIENFSSGAIGGNAQGIFNVPESVKEAETNDPNFVRHHYQLTKRKTTALGGVEYQQSIGKIDFQFQYLVDLLNEHDGQEARISLAHEWQQNRHSINLLAGVVWQDKKSLNYFYGASEKEVSITNVYQPGAGVSTLVRLDWTYVLSQNWDFRSFLSYRHLADDIQASPLVSEKSVTTIFIGGVYHF